MVVYSYQGYHRNKAFIVTQMPLPQTLSDFWQMLYDHKSPAIVLLHDFDHPDPEHEVSQTSTADVTEPNVAEANEISIPNAGLLLAGASRT